MLQMLVGAGLQMTLNISNILKMLDFILQVVDDIETFFNKKVYDAILF